MSNSEQIGESSASCSKCDTIEKEDVLVYVKFENKEFNFNDQDVQNMKFIGIDSEKPIVVVGNETFEGTWKDTATTAMIYEEIDPPKKRCYYSQKVSSRYVCHTRKMLYLTQIKIRPKSPADETSEEKNKKQKQTVALDKIPRRKVGVTFAEMLELEKKEVEDEKEASDEEKEEVTLRINFTNENTAVKKEN